MLAKVCKRLSNSGSLTLKVLKFIFCFDENFALAPKGPKAPSEAGRGTCTGKRKDERRNNTVAKVS